jgi:hypothetical protein
MEVKAVGSAMVLRGTVWFAAIEESSSKKRGRAMPMLGV